MSCSKATAVAAALVETPALTKMFERSARAARGRDLDFRGGDDGTRTHDPLLAKQVLSPAELRPRGPQCYDSTAASVGVSGGLFQSFGLLAARESTVVWRLLSRSRTRADA